MWPHYTRITLHTDTWQYSLSISLPQSNGHWQRQPELWDTWTPPACAFLLLLSILSLYSILTASSPSPTFSFISPSLSVPQGTNQLEQHDDNENEDPPQKSQAFNHFPTWVVLVPLHHHPLRCCELPKRRRFSNASHKIQPEPTQVTRMDRPGPMQMGPRVLLRRQTGYPNPNRAKQSPRHAPWECSEANRVTALGASIQQHHWSTS